MAGTKFSAIYNRFLEKITDDMYMELTVEDTIKDLQSMLINSIPGFGDFSTALFLAEVGDITRFDNKYQFISFIGIDSITSQSGISAYHGPISKSGCKFGRTILFNIVTTIIQLSARFDKKNPIYLFFRKKQSFFL